MPGPCMPTPTAMTPAPESAAAAAAPAIDKPVLLAKYIQERERIVFSLRQKNLWASFGSGSLPST